MSLIYNPHDKFVKASLMQKPIAIDFLKAHLPASLLNKLDLDTLELTNKSYVTPMLKELHGDVVYRCKIDSETGYIPLLFLLEHQSTPDKQMAFRFLEYTIHLMRDHLNANHDQLPIVYPLCVYHGTVSPYPYSTSIYDMFKSPAFAQQVMFKSYQLLDLTTRSLEQLEKDGLASMMEILLKAYQAKQEQQSILEHIVAQGLLSVVIHQTPESYLQYVLNYAMELNDNTDFPAEKLIELFKRALPDKQEQIMTFREQLQQQGLQQGMRLGMSKAKREDARKMLAEEGISREVVKRVTGLSDIELEDLL